MKRVFEPGDRVSQVRVMLPPVSFRDPNPDDREFIKLHEVTHFGTVKSFESVREDAYLVDWGGGELKWERAEDIRLA